MLSNSLLYSWSELVSCTRLNPTLNNVNDDDDDLNCSSAFAVIQETAKTVVILISFIV